MNDLKLELYLSDSAYITALRLVAGAVCAAHDIDVDTAEDFKVCVTESVIILKDGGFEKAQILFRGGEGVTCEVSGIGGVPTASKNEFSLALISALVGECNIENSGGIINKVVLKI